VWAGGSGVQNLVGARFFAPIQTGPGAHPALYSVGTGSFLGLKQVGCGIDHPPHLALRLKEEKRLYLLPPRVFMAC